MRYFATTSDCGIRPAVGRIPFQKKRGDNAMKKILASIISLMLLFTIIESVSAHSEIYENVTITGTNTGKLSNTLTTDTSWTKYTYVESLIVAEGTQDFRYIIAGTPTASNGTLLKNGDKLKLYTLYDMQNIVFANGSTTSSYVGTLTVHHSRSQSEPKGIMHTK